MENTNELKAAFDNELGLEDRFLDDGVKGTFAYIADAELVDHKQSVEDIRKAAANESDYAARQKMHNEFSAHLNYIKKEQRQDYEDWQRYIKEAKTNPKAPKPKSPLAEAMESAGLGKSYGCSFTGLSEKFYAKGDKKVLVKRTGGTTEFDNSVLTNKDVVFAGCQALVGKCKKPTIFPPNPCDPDKARAFIKLSIEGLLSAKKPDGTFAYKVEDLKVGSAAYASILDEYKAHSSVGLIGDVDPEKMNGPLLDSSKFNPQKEDQPSKIKTESEKLVFDAAYNLLRAAERAKNRTIQSNKFDLISSLNFNDRAKNAVNQINDVVTGATHQKGFMREDSSVIAAFTDLNNEMDNFRKHLSKLDEIPTEMKNILKMVDTMKSTGFNVLSENTNWSLPKLSSKANQTLGDVIKTIDGLEGQVKRSIDFDYVDTKGTKSELDKRIGMLDVFKTELKRGDISRASNITAKLQGASLNKVLANDAGSKIFPDDATVLRIGISGEAADLYFFQDKKGTVYEVQGSGNRYGKPKVSELSKSTVMSIFEEVTNKEVSLKPVEPVKEQDLAVAVKDPDAAEKKETVTIKDHKNEFDIEFINGVAIHNKVAYILKSEVADFAATLDSVKDSKPELIAIKSLDAMPTSPACLEAAETLLETKEKPVMINDMFIIPGVTKHLLFGMQGQVEGQSLEAIQESIKELLIINNLKPQDVNGTLTSTVHSYSLPEIKSSNTEELFPTAYDAIKALRKASVDVPVEPVNQKRNADKAEQAFDLDEDIESALDEVEEQAHKRKLKVRP